MKNKKVLMIVAIAVIAGASFYGGMLYGKSATSTQTLGNLSAVQRQQFAASGFAGRGAGGAVAGQIISNDGNSITVKMNDGGSKIVFFSDSTKISKSDSGTAKDLTNNSEVIVNGQANSDGSVTAQSIQIRLMAQQK